MKNWLCQLNKEGCFVKTQGNFENALNKGMKRRTFLKATGAVGGAAIAGGGGFAIKEAMHSPTKALAETPKKYEIYRSSCAMECLHCSLTAYVKDGKIEKVEPTTGLQTQGCLRGISRTQWLYNTDRLTKPLLRVGEKGKGEFKEISWDEALDLMEEKIRETISTVGNKGIVLTAGSGNMDNIKNAFASNFFQYIGGNTNAIGQTCCQAVTDAMIPITGTRGRETRDTIKDSKYILCWGNNPAVTMQAFYKFYEEAQEKGAKIVVIDPRYSETAARADEWIPILPSTDTALALGMLNVIFTEDLIDRDFLQNHTGAGYLIDQMGNLVREDSSNPDSYVVFDLVSQQVVLHSTEGIVPALSSLDGQLPDGMRTALDFVIDEAKKWTPEKVQEETDVPAGMVYRLARDYANSEAAMIIQNMSGAQRTEYGVYVVATQFYLALVTGQIGRPGTGVDDTGGASQFVQLKSSLNPPAVTEDITPIPVTKLGEVISNSDDYKFWYHMTSSLMTQNPNTNLIKKALKKVPFVVVADNLMTSTALYADLVLPVTTIFEDVSIMVGGRSNYVHLMDKAVEPPGEAKPDYWIMTELAKRFGVGTDFDKPIEKHIEIMLEGTGFTIEQLRKEGPIKPYEGDHVPFHNGEFFTSTKKANFYIESWKEGGFPPVGTYIRADEFIKNQESELVKKYPLMAVQRKTPKSIHSSFSALEWPLEVHGDKPTVQIHPNDAKRRNIEHGELVVVTNDRGYHKTIANVTTHIKEGIVAIENGWWEQQGGSSSYVTNDKEGFIGYGHCCNNTLVDVIKEV